MEKEQRIYFNNEWGRLSVTVADYIGPRILELWLGEQYILFSFWVLSVSWKK